MTKDEVLKAQKIRIENFKKQNDILSDKLKFQNQIIKNLNDEVRRLKTIIEMQDAALNYIKGE